MNAFRRDWLPERSQFELSGDFAVGDIFDAYASNAYLAAMLAHDRLPVTYWIAITAFWEST